MRADLWANMPWSMTGQRRMTKLVWADRKSTLTKYDQIWISNSTQVIWKWSKSRAISRWSIGLLYFDQQLNGLGLDRNSTLCFFFLYEATQLQVSCRTCSYIRATLTPLVQLGSLVNIRMSLGMTDGNIFILLVTFIADVCWISQNSS